MDSAFFNCPIECPSGNGKTFDYHRSKYCDDCDQKKERDKFKQTVSDLIFDFMGESNFKFDRLEQTIYQVVNFLDLPPEKTSVKTAALINVYQSEESRWKKQKREEEDANKDK